MALHTRPNGSTYFTDDPAVDPATGAKIDADLNALVSTINALDNANIAATPKISSAKVDLTTGGYVPLDGSADMSATLVQAFEGIFREMRADGNAKIYDYQGSDGALWGVSYNTYWTGSAWSGRDTTAICAVLKMESDGLHYYHAVSGASGSTPTWTEIFHASLTGITAGSLKDNTITEARLDWANAGGLQQGTILDNSELTHTGDTNWTEKATGITQIYIPTNSNSLEYKTRMKTSNGVGGLHTASCRIGIGATNGTVLTSDSTVYGWSSVATIDVSAISGWQSVDIDLMQEDGAEIAYVNSIVYRII